MVAWQTRPIRTGPLHGAWLPHLYMCKGVTQRATATSIRFVNKTICWLISNNFLKIFGESVNQWQPRGVSPGVHSKRKAPATESGAGADHPSEEFAETIS